MQKKDDLAEIEDLEIAPLSDDDLESVAGGARVIESGSCSCCETDSGCTGGFAE